MIKQTLVATLICGSSFGFGQSPDISQINQSMETMLAKLGQSAVQYECKVDSKEVVPDATLKERFPNGTVSFTAPHLVAVTGEHTTSPLIMYGAYLTDDGRVYQTSKLSLKVVQYGRSALVETSIVGRNGVKSTTHWFTDGTGSKVLVERFAEDGVQRNGQEKNTVSPMPYTPRYQVVYELPDPKRYSPEVETVSGDAVKATFTDDKGNTAFTIDPARTVVTKKVDQNSRRLSETILSDFSKVGEFDLPGTKTKKESDPSGKFLMETVISEWKFKILDPEEANSLLKLDFPDGTVIGQGGPKGPAPGF